MTENKVKIGEKIGRKSWVSQKMHAAFYYFSRPFSTQIEICKSFFNSNFYYNIWFRKWMKSLTLFDKKTKSSSILYYISYALCKHHQRVHMIVSCSFYIFISSHIYCFKSIVIHVCVCVRELGHKMYMETIRLVNSYREIS